MPRPTIRTPPATHVASRPDFPHCVALSRTVPKKPAPPAKSQASSYWVGRLDGAANLKFYEVAVDASVKLKGVLRNGVFVGVADLHPSDYGQVTFTIS